jgi:eukaryotic-like serine/threonine-protein kinase
MKMVKIPAGKFTRENQQVMMPEFYLGQTLVTQVQWQEIMGSNPSQFKGDDKLPVDSVSWLDATDFCEKLSEKRGRIYRLPSEAEWEYACRGGTTRPFAFGKTITPEIVNYNGNYPYGAAAKGENREKTTVVRSFPANSFGLYDMHGNLWEWCLDEWFNSYNGAPLDGSPRGDIKSRSHEKQRLLRGGSWVDDADNCRSAVRDLNTASVSDDNFIGFRVLAVAPRTS